MRTVDCLESYFYYIIFRYVAIAIRRAPGSSYAITVVVFMLISILTTQLKG